MRKLILLFFLFVIIIQGSSSGAAPFAVSTFECLGVYWDPLSGGSLADTCKVQYRKQGDAVWKQGLPLVFFNRAGAASYIGGKYRGSIVNLTQNTTYEISLKLKISGDSAVFTATTWNDNFPIAQTITLPVTSSSMLNITQSGTATGYILYAPASGSTATIDVNNNSAQCINISASYIIIRGVTLKNGAANGILLGNVHDVVIENCDISGWGEIFTDGFGVNRDAAVKSTFGALTRIIVQRTKIHHPRSNSNSWQQPRPALGGAEPNHPAGPQCIDFNEGDGNHVFRYNEIYSDSAHRYNDAIGGGYNGSYKGFPNRDTDVYGNYISFEWDDAIEMEGANRNVRVWGNFIDTFASGITSASTSIGPYYVWRNVLANSHWGPNWSIQSGNYFGGGPGDFFKGGAGGNQSYMGGQIYIFHNTLLQPTGKYSPTCGVVRGIANTPDRNIYSRNNILHVQTASSISIVDGDVTCDYNYDLFNGTIAGPSRTEVYGKKGVPTYAVNSFDPATKKGSFQLASTSLGFDQGYPVPNFSDGFIGSAPDMGANEAGAPPMEFGVNAYLNSSGIEQNPINKSFNFRRSDNSTISNIITGKKSITFLVSPKNSGNWTLDLYNIIGKKIWEYKTKVTGGIHSVKYENENIPMGQYFVKFKQNNSQSTSRFVVIK